MFGNAEVKAQFRQMYMSDVRLTLYKRYIDMDPLILVFIASFGVVEPELGTSCEEALAALIDQKLQIVDVDVPDTSINTTVHYIMAKKGRHISLYPRQSAAKVAILDCRSSGNQSDYRLVVSTAFHSGNVKTLAPPAFEEEKECAQHLAELMSEGLGIVETSLVFNSRQRFHLSNNSSRNPKAAIILCRNLEPPPPPPPPPPPQPLP